MTRWLPEKKDRRVPTTTDVFLQYHLGYVVTNDICTEINFFAYVRTFDEQFAAELGNLIQPSK